MCNSCWRPAVNWQRAAESWYSAMMKLRAYLGLGVVLPIFACSPAQNVKEPNSGEEAGADADGSTAGDEERSVGGKLLSCAEYDKTFCDASGIASSRCETIRWVTASLSDKSCKALLRDASKTVAALEAEAIHCQTLSQTICDHLGEDTLTCQETSEQIKEMPPEQCKNAMEHIDEILKDMERREAANQPISAELQKEIAAVEAPSFGPADAPVTVVVFSDFQCPYCSKAADVAHVVREKYEGKVRFVFRQFPLSFHKDAHLAAEASLAAHAQGKFWEFHDQLFENQKKLSREDLESYAKALGLNMKKFKAALDDGTYQAAVDADFALGSKKVGVSGTPSMFINGKRAKNATSASAVSAEINAIMAAQE